MTCARCGTEAVPDARFCGECGASLAAIVVCPGCGAESPAGQRFCSSCGHALSADHARARTSAWPGGGEGATVGRPGSGGGDGGTVDRPGGGGGDRGTVDRSGTRGAPEAAVDPASGPDPREYTPAHLAEKILGARADLDGERKQVTVLFADVIGSMQLSEQTDP
jgi:predicted nucleic acid-binding Zn ribbon protein